MKSDIGDKKDENVAGNGLLHRRALLKASTLGIAGGFLLPAQANFGSIPGAPQSVYGKPSRFTGLQREQTAGHPFGPEAGSSSSPLQLRIPVKLISDSGFS